MDAQINHALQVLENALDSCNTDDNRSPEITAALAVLRVYACETWPFEAFEEAMANSHQHGAWQGANAALNGICRVIGATRAR